MVEICSYQFSKIKLADVLEYSQTNMAEIHANRKTKQNKTRTKNKPETKLLVTSYNWTH